MVYRLCETVDIYLKMSTISHMQRSQVVEAMRLARKKGVFTAREAARQGIHSQILTRLVREGAVERRNRQTA